MHMNYVDKYYKVFEKHKNNTLLIIKMNKIRKKRPKKASQKLPLSVIHIFHTPYPQCGKTL